MIIQRRCRFCLVENMGGRICLEGRSQNNIVEWSLSMNGIKMGGVKSINKKWPSKKSELHSDISTILTINSRAGCDIADVPRPLPYHLPVHQARLVSSCLYSRVKNTAIRIFWIARWIAIMAMRPRTACDESQSSRNQKNSKNPILPTNARIWAIPAMIDANLAQCSIIGPRNSEMKNKVMRTAAFQTTGPIAMTLIRTRGLGFWFPLWSGKDLTNI